ncbi:MgtC/SapB transporter [Desulfofarcimen acetoxidans DSM 771]|uniref:MgtC/SapB transporter n=2 Tax=Desulfofarcimen acetoxidans TaxID=58138 RepID=C8VWI3_DESAS|nr:MgtC/SapB transporter [Desulfofarcimen acetoxidans DSM 771]
MRHILNLPFEIYLRIVLSMIAGIIMGSERTIYNKPAGIRTFSLVSLGSTLIMLLSVYGAERLGIKAEVDPFRVAAQIVSGIGFIGAGVIWNSKNGVKRGITTAAELWVVSAIGMALGVGMYDLVVLVMVCIFMVMRIGHIMGKYTRNKVKREHAPEQMK